MTQQPTSISPPQGIGTTLRDVATRLPARRPSSVRRTSDLQIVPLSGWDGDVEVTGTARDAGVDAYGVLTTTATARTTVTLEDASVLRSLTGNLPPAVAEALLGRPAVAGFRSAMRHLPPDQLAQDSLEAALLDDLPTVRLISGYGRMIEMDHRPGRPSPAMLGVCRGWAPGDTADRVATSGERLLGQAPAAPDLQSMLDAPDDFHPQVTSPPSSMRRRRILEIARSGDQVEIYTYFRDSHIDATGREGSLHEYEVHATVSAGSLVVSSITVRPRALPFPECPLASPNAEALVGTSLTDIDGSVRGGLSGVRGCTHLNDVLRFLRFVKPLADRLP